MSVALYPYNELQGTIALTIAEVRLDGKEMPWQTINSDALIVELRNPDEHQWRTATIAIKVKGPAAELQARANEISDVQVVGVLDCRSTNHRLAVYLDPDVEVGTWSGAFDIDRGDWFGQATLITTIVATVNQYESRQAGSSAPWVVRFDDLPPREINNAMRVLWEDFAKPANNALSFLVEFADHLCFLRLDTDEPILYLNEGFTNLRALLDEKAGRPRAQRALRAQVLADIASSTWHAMFTAALESVEVDDDGEPSPPPEGWQRNVLDALLPRLYPEISLDEARRDAWEARRDPHAAASLQERLLPTISQHVQQPKALRAALRSMELVDLGEQL